jgi:hypothetical protein
MGILSRYCQRLIYDIFLSSYTIGKKKSEGKSMAKLGMKKKPAFIGVQTEERRS